MSICASGRGFTVVVLSCGGGGGTIHNFVGVLNLKDECPQLNPFPNTHTSTHLTLKQHRHIHLQKKKKTENQHSKFWKRWRIIKIDRKVENIFLAYTQWRFQELHVCVCFCEGSNIWSWQAGGAPGCLSRGGEWCDLEVVRGGEGDAHLFLHCQCCVTSPYGTAVCSYINVYL